jgi:hypothetical protein
MVVASTKRGLLAFVGVVGLVIWTIQLINGVTIDYKQHTYVTDTVNPGTTPTPLSALKGNVWFVIIPLVFLTLLVMTTLVRWVVSSSYFWRIAHIVMGFLVIIVSIVVVIAVSIVFLAGGNWKSSNNNIAADERLCCMRPSINIVSPIIPGCPVLFNNCNPDLSLLPDSEMHWNGAFTCFFVLLFIDLMLAIVLVIISFWMADGENTKGVYSQVSLEQGTAALQSVATSSVVQNNSVNLRTITPVGVVATASVGGKQHSY